MRKILALLGVLFFITSAVANEQQKVEEFFLQKIDEVTAIVSDKGLSKDDRNKKIVDTLDPIFDFEIMAKLSLGKKWSVLSSEDQVKFISLYVERMKQSYSSKLDEYSGEKFEIIDSKQKKSNRIELNTNLISTEKKFDVKYKFYKPKTTKENKNDWLIYDVEILGVSILKTDRAQFKEYLQTHSLNELMEELSKNNS
jgi:phospholipid transport system substrate-binding protein